MSSVGDTELQNHKKYYIRIHQLETIELDIRKPRKAQEVPGQALSYMSRDARTLFKLLCLYPLTFVAAGLLISYLIIGRPPTPERIFYARAAVTKNSFLFLLISCLIYLLGYCLVTFVSTRVMLLRDSGEDNNISVKEMSGGLWQGVREHIFNFLLVYLIYFAVTFGLSWIRLSGIFEDIGFTDSGVESAIGMMIYNIPYLLVMPLLFYFCLGSLFVSQRDHIGTAEALKKVWETTQHDFRKVWLSSMLVIVICYLFSLFLGIVLNYGGYLVMKFFDSDYAVFFMISSLIQSLATCLLFMFTQVAMVLLYGTMEDDKDGHFIKSKIESI